jgi:hypothetical protein
MSSSSSPLNRVSNNTTALTYSKASPPRHPHSPQHTHTHTHASSLHTHQHPTKIRPSQYMSLTIQPHHTLCRTESISHAGSQNWYFSSISIDYTQYRIPLLLLACLQAFLASGIFYGWSSMYVLFLEKGVYSELCDTDQTPHHNTGHSNTTDTTNNLSKSDVNPICVAQKSALQLIYTIASSVNLIMQLPWGYLLDCMGPRMTSSVSLSLVISGFMMLANASQEWNLYLPAVSLISAAGRMYIRSTLSESIRCHLMQHLYDT